MNTEDAKVIVEANQFYVNLPLTKTSGKIRIKRRSFFAYYGEPVAPRQTKLTSDCYVEWQIGYDLLAKDENKYKTSLSHKTFVNNKGDVKFGYELSEITYYAKSRGLLSTKEIQDCVQAIQRIPNENTFEETESIRRTNPKIITRNDMPFYAMEVSYPLFVHRFGKYEILAEIMIREKQKAIGTQAMLYVCLPLSSLTFSQPPFGRELDTKECAKWIIGKEEATLSLELLRVFGMLSPKHRHDTLAILKMLFPKECQASE